MAMNRIQFQPGLSLAQFLDTYGTEARCRAALEKARWPMGFRCPDCGAQGHSRHERGGQLLLQCRACRHQTSLIAGTVFDSTKLPLTRWFLALFFLTLAKNNLSALALKRHLGVCYKTAWLLKHKLMEAMRQAETTRVLEGRIEIDDAYLGGERSGGKAGRGAENKVPFVAAVQTNDQGHPFYVRLDPVPGFTQEALSQWGQRYVAPGTVVCSDGLYCFTALAPRAGAHQVTVVGSGKQAVQHPQFRWVNTLLGNFKRAVSGTYHAFKFEKYARRYLAEYAYRFNRRFQLPALVPSLIADCALMAPLPARRIRLAEVCR